MGIRVVKREIKKCLPWILKIAPPGVAGRLAGRLVRKYPHLISLVPPGKALKSPKFLGKFTVLIDTVYPIECEMLAGIWDKRTVGVIDRFVRPGDVCFDVGANVGAITFALARATGETGKVFAFEPGPPIFQRLADNIALNPALSGIVRTYRIGLSDRPGTLKWSEDMNNRGNGGLLESEGTDVPVITLDDFCAQNSISRIDFIKVDVEGMEYEVFKGAEATLRKLHPILYFETLQPFVEFRGFNIFAKIEQMLKELGYKLFKIDKNENVTGTTSSDLSENTLAIAQDNS